MATVHVLCVSPPVPVVAAALRRLALFLMLGAAALGSSGCAVRWVAEYDKAS